MYEEWLSLYDKTFLLFTNKRKPHAVNDFAPDYFKTKTFPIFLIVYLPKTGYEMKNNSFLLSTSFL
jgi:hypothetical protein